jgi:hypothetical protein
VMPVAKGRGAGGDGTRREQDITALADQDTEVDRSSDGNMR